MSDNTSIDMIDMIDTKVLIISGNNTKEIILNIDTIKNVLALKHINTIAVLSNTELLKKIYIKINDYELKTLHSNNSTFEIFDSLTFKKNVSDSFCYNESCESGININFRLDTKNYVFNPILNKLMKLHISFFELINDELVAIELEQISMELCIYSNRAKLTMV